MLRARSEDKELGLFSGSGKFRGGWMHSPDGFLRRHSKTRLFPLSLTHQVTDTGRGWCLELIEAKAQYQNHWQ